MALPVFGAAAPVAAKIAAAFGAGLLIGKCVSDVGKSSNKADDDDVMGDIITMTKKVFE